MTQVRRRHGDLLALLASLDGTRETLHQSTSADEGRSWGAARATPLPSNGDPVQAAVLRSGRMVVVFSNGVRLRCVGLRQQTAWVRCSTTPGQEIARI